ncbi:MAG: hypothetical protein KAQ68_07655 [Clostridiales bacterium]|nr:hypothetical protein [Clostridiales bacterium]
MRADGRRIKSLDPLFAIIPHIMPKRYDAQVMFNTEVNYTQIRKYLNKKRNDGHNIGFMALFTAAYLRTVSHMPELNRFVINKKIFARKEFCVSFVVLKEGEAQEDTLETVVKIRFNLTDTIFEVSEKIDKEIEANRKQTTVNFTDKLAKFFMSIPLLSRFVIILVKGLDKIGLLPKALIDGFPFHASLFITNLASIYVGPVFHHIYDFGTTSMFVSIGMIKNVLNLNGEKEQIVPIGVVADERICAGVTFGKAFGFIKKYVNNPTMLESSPDEIREDIK